MHYWFGTATFDTSYATSGESLTAADLDMASVSHLLANSEDGFDYRYNYSGELLLAYEAGGGATAIGQIVDDNSASSTGADLQVTASDRVGDALEENKWNALIGGFEAINGGDANIFTSQVGLSASGTNPTFIVWDNDAAESENVTNIDVYSQAAGAGLNANNILVATSLYVPCSTGIFIEVADGVPGGVLCFFDHDASDAAKRLLSTVAADADTTFPTTAQIGMQANSGTREVASTFDLSAAVVRIQAFGPPAN